MSKVWSKFLCRFGRSCVLVGGFILVASAQVHIKEQVNIKPSAIASIQTSATSSPSYLNPPAYAVRSAGIPYVPLPSTISVSGTIDFSSSQLERRQWVLLRMTGVGPTAIELQYMERTQGDQIIERSGSFNGPVGICGGGLPQLLTFDGRVVSGTVQWIVSGDGVEYTMFNSLLQGPDRHVVPVTATAKVSASVQAGFSLAQFRILATADSIICSGTSRLTITALNGNGVAYSVCSMENANADVTVSMEGGGDYAFLRGNSQEGKSITIPFITGTTFAATKTCDVVLDGSKIIPQGRDVVTISVTGGLVTSTKLITLKCNYPPPTVQITNPLQDTTIVLTTDNLPVIELMEHHAPETGQFEPVISWDPSNIIDTRNYFDEIEDSLVINAVVKARNIAGIEVTDQRKITLKKVEIFCTQVNFGSGSIKAGDTTSLTFKKILNDGTEEEFEGGQLFNASASGGGKLLSDSTTGSSLSGIPMPVYFIAPDAIEADSIEISVVAEPTGGGGGGLASAFRIGAQQMAASGSSRGISSAAGQECDEQSIWVKKKPELHHFEVEIQPDTVRHGESALISATAKDAENNDFALDGNTLLKLTIDNEEYGSFINARGDTIPSPLDSISYSEVAGKGIKFTTNKTNPAGSTPQKVTVMVEKRDDEGKNGKGSVIVKRNLIVKIEKKDPRILWPLLPNTGKGESRGADQSGFNAKRTFTILVQDGLNRPVKDEKIQILTKYEQGTGGHGHEGFQDDEGTTMAKKELPQNLQGSFYANNIKTPRNPIHLNTDEKGVAKVDSFIASQASGKYLVSARSIVDTTLMDSINLQIQVSDLVEFGTGQYWNLTGTISNRGKNHLSNHWCTQKMKDSLTAALKAFYEWTESEEGGGNAIKLDINDISLEWGGAFDISGTWAFGTQHSFHRVGLSVDINREPGNLRKDDGILNENGEQLKKIMEKLGAQKYKEKEIHFGFDGGK